MMPKGVNFICMAMSASNISIFFLSYTKSQSIEEVFFWTPFHPYFDSNWGRGLGKLIPQTSINLQVICPVTLNL